MTTSAPLVARRPPKPERPLSIDELTGALKGGLIRVRYQPVVRLGDRRPMAIEALARLEHPVRGTMRPDHFVPQLENAGLGPELTRAVAERAFAEWGGGLLGEYGLQLAINVPLDVMLDEATLAWIDTTRQAAGIEAGSVVLELTESRVLDRLDELRTATGGLRDIGYGLAIDDVGPHIRDHRALLDMRFTCMKLDKDVVRESVDSESAHAFLLEAVADARASELKVVAEGIEDQDMWARMQSLGVSWGQGFLIARPLPAVAVPTWQRDWCARHDVTRS